MREARADVSGRRRLELFWLRYVAGLERSLGQLADVLDMSSRTLARYLDAEITTFRDLTLPVPTSRAHSLLVDGERSATGIG